MDIQKYFAAVQQMPDQVYGWTLQMEVLLDVAVKQGVMSNAKTVVAAKIAVDGLKMFVGLIREDAAKIMNTNAEAIARDQLVKQEAAKAVAAADAAAKAEADAAEKAEAIADATA